MAAILIVGLGYIGKALEAQLVKQGHQVYGLSRTPRNTSGHFIQKDIFDLHPEELPKQIDYVFYMISADRRDIESYKQAYPQGVKKIIDCLVEGGCAIKRFFYISSTRVCQSLGDNWVDEETPLEKEDPFATILIEAEQLVNGSLFNSTIVRLGGIYGPARCHLLSQVKSKAVSYVVNDVYTNRIHQADVVGMLIHLMNIETIEPLYIGVDSCPTLYNDLIGWLAQNRGVTLQHSSEPSKRASKKISNARLLKTGYKFQFPDFKSGYKELLI